MIKTVIFDLDGTLVDTETISIQVIKNCFVTWGMNIDPEDATFITGRRWAVVVDYLFQKYKFPIDRNEVEEDLLKAYRKAVNQSLPVVPGAQQAILSLASKFPLGLVSGSYRNEILFVLDQMNVRSYFNVILGAQDYKESKPNPQGYLLAMKMLNSEPKNTLIFEDSIVGISSAREAGACVVAITGTNHLKLNQDQAHKKIPDFTKVNSDWVSQLKF